MGNSEGVNVYLSFGQRHILVVVALNEEKSGISQDITQLACWIYNNIGNSCNLITCNSV